MKKQPFLSYISIRNPFEDSAEYPYNLPFLKNGLELQLEKNVTFLVGENGAGKSTILEAIASKIGFNPSGGGRNHFYESAEKESVLAQHTFLGWTPNRINEGFFLRAESFFNFASYIDATGSQRYGRPLMNHSHGESFLALFQNNFQFGIYLLDEPEAALSPRRLLELMAIIHNLEQAGEAQFIIVTHSPILMSYPNGQILSLDFEKPKPITYQETDHYQFTKSFLDNPDAYFRHLFMP
jgi:predicted ATPase